MRIVIKTQDPEALKTRIVSDVENGNLPTWELRTNKKDDKLLTHSGEQWADKVRDQAFQAHQPETPRCSEFQNR